ncbi:MAG: cadmium-translocating P-type ATPase [Methanobrevibacter sp.]|nr:cadmium-translocating P-type ATPase [Methanobrevibacter sp.]
MKYEKIKIIQIIISAICVILSFILNIEQISWIALILCGIPIFKECAEGLIKEFDIKADLLVSIAIISSIIIGEVFAAGEIATIMTIGGFLEEYTVSKTQNRIKELVKITPQIATKITNKTEEKIPAEEIKTGDILKILPGEIIPTDGIIINGESSIDQSTLTGESLPVDKSVNDEVYSGCVNLYGSFLMKTTKLSKDSSLQKLIKLVESSSADNSKIVRQTDKWATLIVVIAFTAAILTYLATFEIIRSVTILVVFCPCALVLATPTAIIATIGNLTKFGILVKNGESIEELAHVSEVVFDKTGTLTKGKPEVVKIISDNPQEMMYLLASIESKSEHPLAKAIVKYYNNNDLTEVNNFKMHIGMGVTGEINGDKIIAGNKKLMKNENIKIRKDKRIDEKIELFIAKNNELLGKIYLSDPLRGNAKITIEEMKKLKVKTTLLTGDSEKPATKIANKLKIRNVKFNCLPEDKIEYIQKEQTLGHKVAMIGDGINDAPSLKKSDVGIAMGSIGSDISIEAAKITLLNDNIEDIPHLIKIAKKTLRTINISIGFALILNIIAMSLAILGFLNPIQGALIHNIGSVFVIIYSTKLIRYNISKKEYSKENLGITKSLNKTMPNIKLNTIGEKYD